MAALGLRLYNQFRKAGGPLGSLGPKEKFRGAPGFTGGLKIFLAPKGGKFGSPGKES